jgi:uncharacterized protein involved in outer membrane biogenesis
MTRLLRYAGLVLAVPLVLAAGALALDFNEYRDDIAAALERHTGVAVEIHGDVRLKPAFVPTLVIEDLYGQNAPWATRANLVRIGRIELSPELLPLLSHVLVIERMVLTDVEINVETDGEGRINWGSGRQVKTVFKPPSDTSGSFPDIRHLIVEDLTVRFDAGWAKVEKVYEVDSIEARSNGFDQPILVALKTPTESGGVSVEGTLGSARTFTRDEAFPVELRGTFGSADIALTGRIQAPRTAQTFDVRLALEGDSASEIGSFAGYRLQEDTPVKITARATGDRSRFTLGDVMIRLGHLLIRPQE